MTHIINKQYIHVELAGTESEGVALHATLSALSNGLLLREMTSVLDGFGGGEDSICIELLELDLGNISLDTLDAELVPCVTRVLNDALQHKRDQGLIVRGDFKDNIIVRSPRQTLLAVFLHFLKTGTLPWFYRLPSGKRLEQVLLEFVKPSPDGRSAEIIGEEVGAALRFPGAFDRLMLQFSPEFQASLLTVISPDVERTIERVLSTLEGSSGKTREHNIEDPTSQGSMQSQQPPRPRHSREVVRRTIVEESFRLLATGARLEEGSLLTAAARVFESSDMRTPLQSGTPPRPAAALKKVTSLKRTAADASADGKYDESVITEGLYIDNAGLAILHPFLPRFFEVLGIADDTGLLNPDRALSLLHFAATGQKNAPEYELILPKLLCGIAPGQPVDSLQLLTETETSETEKLLRAVIGHWEALRNTSPDGMRGTFLMRPGKLSVGPDGEWLLQVESRAYDILLDHLPWGISLIQLQWMKHRLRVEWITSR